MEARSLCLLFHGIRNGILNLRREMIHPTLGLPSCQTAKYSIWLYAQTAASRIHHMRPSEGLHDVEKGPLRSFQSQRSIGLRIQERVVVLSIGLIGTDRTN